MPRKLPVVLTALLIITSGCGALPGFQEQRQTSSPTEELTPPPGTPSQTDFPEGATNNSLTPKVASIHNQTLSQTSFSVVVEITTRSEIDGQVRKQRRVEQYRYTPDSGVITRSSRQQSSALWFDTSNGSEEAWRKQRIGNNTAYRPAEPVSSSVFTSSFFISSVISGFEFEFVGTQGAGDGIRYVYRSTGVSNPDPLLKATGYSSVRDAAARLAITEEGIVSTLDLYVEGDESSTEYLFEVTSVGDTTVEEPDWVETARDEAYLVDAKMADDRSHIVINFSQGRPLQPNTSQILFAGGPLISTLQFNQTLKPNSTYYITRSNGNVTITSEKPATDKAVFNDSVYLIRGFEGRLTLFEDRVLVATNETSPTTETKSRTRTATPG